jgi:hypothetical protein
MNITPSVKINGDSLVFEENDDRTTQFSWPIRQVIQFNGLLIVRVEPDPNIRFNQNVYAVDRRTGEILWQIERREYGYGNSPYTSVCMEGTKLIAGNWDGWDDTVDLSTGKILGSRFSK